MVTPAPKPPPLGRLRLATVADAPNILELINESIAKTFRVECNNDILYLIENCVLSICQLDTSEGIIGFIAARDYPLVPSVHSSSWESYVWTKYKAIEMNARNTLFLHMLCWNPAYSRDVVDGMLKSIFMHDPYVQHIAMVKSLSNYALLIPGQSRSEASFRRVAAMERGCNTEILPALYIADRTEVSPRLRIRRAVEEDNDDIVPIIENHATIVGELYGEFYISELISRHPESDRVLLVCEHKELAVGVMCLNTTVNFEALEENFILAPFGGLRHLDTQPELTKADESDVSAVSLITVPRCTEPILPSDTHRNEYIMERSSQALSAQSFIPIPEKLFSILFDDEYDEYCELDFDIVNIDTEHLRVPEFLYSALSTEPAVDEVIKKDVECAIHSNENYNNNKRTNKMLGSNLNLASKQPEQFIRYQGTPNAFLIELFAMHSQYDERYGFDILEAAFEIFPNRDYCVISLPSKEPPFPLLEHFTLVTPIGSRKRFINESLYVAHVNSVRGKMSVRLGEKYDMTALEDILENSPRLFPTLKLYESSLKSHTLESFVFLSENQPIGVVIIGPKLDVLCISTSSSADFSPLENATAVRTHYDLEPEPRRPGTDASILAGVMSPALEPHSRWYMREILRQSRYSTLFWSSRMFGKGDASPLRNLMSLAGYMSPIHPRKSVPNISGNKDLDKIIKQISTPFSLWMLERPLTSLPKVHVNSSIVVVGASRTGLAFLETLLMGPTSHYLTFSNVTLVSKHGLSTVADCLKAADICVPRNGRFTDRYIKSVPFYFYVDVVSAIMVGIDRKRKCIYLKNGTTKYYDELVLTCGQQFQHPDYLKDALKLANEVQEGKPCDRLLMDNPKYQPDRVPPPPDLPDNVFLINSLYSANINLRKLMRMISDTKQEGYKLSLDNQVVVYGDCVEAYTCIAALLELGIQAKFIVFVEPFPSDDPTDLRVNCFNDETVDSRVQAKLEELGIRIIHKCSLHGWKLSHNFVESLDLMTPMHAISLNCFALFYYGRQAIDLYAFKAINECGLVYDGGLVVSPKFETNDTFIFGAGTCVSYSRKLYATRRLHRNFCSEDIGEALANFFIGRLDPFVCASGVDELFADTVTCTSSTLLSGYRSHASFSMSSFSRARDSMNAYRRWQPVLRFESPIAQFATLPGPLYYMKVRKPGKEIPQAVAQILPHQGHILTTDKNKNYFSLKLNALHVVEHITCLSNKNFSFDIMSQLFGKHEAFFDKLLTRYMKNEIEDFYDFFTQPWMSVVYQETFKELLDDINSQDVGLIYELIKSKFTTYDEEDPRKESAMRKSRVSRISDLSTLEEQAQTGTFRSMIEKHVTKTTSDIEKAVDNGDIPWECGQDKSLHKEILKFWKQITGQRIVSAHLAKYLDKNSVINPHYAKPSSEK